MLTRKLLSLALLFAFALPAALADAQSAPPVEPVDPIVPAEPLPPADPAEQNAIVGKWMLKSVEADGEIEELEDGAFVVEFLADGTMKTYEDGEPSDTGRYTIDGDTITVHMGDDEGESSTFSIDGATMKVKQEVVPGVEMTITFVRVAGE